MKIEIVTPDEVLFNGEVKSVAVPGVNGEFQILENHAPIVSVLTKGYVKLYGNIEPRENVASRFEKSNKKDEFLLAISGGTLELNNNRVVILAD